MKKLYGVSASESSVLYKLYSASSRDVQLSALSLCTHLQPSTAITLSALLFSSGREWFSSAIDSLSAFDWVGCEIGSDKLHFTRSITKRMTWPY